LDDLASLRLGLADDDVYYTDRLDRQHSGRGELLTAWFGIRPVGDVYLWFDPADEPEIRRHLPDVPLLQRARVAPEHRDKGIGTSLMMMAEDRLRLRGYERVALAVLSTNTSAARLYHRLGYQDWGHGLVSCSPREAGRDETSNEVDICEILVKSLDC
jgi:GNAT superfamily N-acetyltransferase